MGGTRHNSNESVLDTELQVSIVRPLGFIALGVVNSSENVLWHIFLRWGVFLDSGTSIGKELFVDDTGLNIMMTFQNVLTPLRFQLCQ